MNRSITVSFLLIRRDRDYPLLDHQICCYGYQFNSLSNQVDVVGINILALSNISNCRLQNHYTILPFPCAHQARTHGIPSTTFRQNSLDTVPYLTQSNCVPFMGKVLSLLG